MSHNDPKEPNLDYQGAMKQLEAERKVSKVMEFALVGAIRILEQTDHGPVTLEECRRALEAYNALYSKDREGV